MRLVLDTNLLVSAFLWQGKPGQLIALAGEKQILLYTSRTLIDELTVVLHRTKLARQVAATGLTPAQMIANYRQLTTLVTAQQLSNQVSRDADDDAVLACALAADADLIVSGDADLLVLHSFRGIPITNAASALATVSVNT